jgi:hypothetical protein
MQAQVMLQDTHSVLVNILYESVLLFPLSSLICGDQISCKDVELLDVQTLPEDVLKNPECQVFPLFRNQVYFSVPHNQESELSSLLHV